MEARWPGRQSSYRVTARYGGHPDMNKPVAPGRIRWAILCLALAASGALPATAGADASRVEVIVQIDAGRSAAAAKAEVRADGGKVTGDLPIINGFAAELSQDAADRLEDADGVKAVTVDAAVKPQGVSLTRLQTRLPRVGRRSAAVELRHERHGQGRRRRGHRHRHRRADARLQGRGLLVLAGDRQRRHQPRRPHGGRRLRPRHARRRASSPATAGTAPTPTRCAASTSASRPTPT